MKKKNLKILLWVLTIFMIISALAYFPSVASIIMLLFAAIAIPLEPVRNFWKEKRLFGLTKGIFLTVLFFVSVGMVPTSDKVINDVPAGQQIVQQSDDSSTLDTANEIDQEVLPVRRSAPEANPGEDLESETESVPAPVADSDLEMESAAVPDTEPEIAVDPSAESETAVDPDTKSEPVVDPDAESEPVTTSGVDLPLEPEPVEEPNPSTAPSENSGTPSTSTNLNNFNTYDNEDQQQTSSHWVLNTSTKKIHYPSCSQVKKIAPQNYSTSNLSESELISKGYTTCGVCHR